jgi:hypothetical protein
MMYLALICDDYEERCNMLWGLRAHAHSMDEAGGWHIMCALH